MADGCAEERRCAGLLTIVVSRQLSWHRPPSGRGDTRRRCGDSFERSARRPGTDRLAVFLV